MRGLVVIPTYNEKENITEITKAVLELPYSLEILIVDDNSPDGTGVLADKLCGENERIHVIHNPVKK